MASKPTALFLSPEWPYPLVGGGALRAASVLEYLMARYQVDVICFRQPGASPVPPGITTTNGDAGLRKWCEVQLPDHRTSLFARGRRNLGRALRGVPPLVDRFRGFEPEILTAIGDATYDLTVVEHFWCSDYTDALRARSKKLVLDMHNAESLWHVRCAQAVSPWIRPFYERFAKAAREMEAERLPIYDLILATSQAEADYISQQLPGLPLVVVPNTIPMRPMPEVERDDTIVFSGNMEYMPNQRAVRYFAAEIWPLIRKKYPNFRWKILGKSASILRQQVQGVPGLLFVSDPDDAMIEIAKSRVAVVPLTAGAGTRLKIIEAWAAGCPVVSTTIGAEGLEYKRGTDIFIQDSPIGFAEQVIQVIDHPSLAQELQRAGRQRFEQSYSWACAWEAMGACGL